MEPTDSTLTQQSPHVGTQNGQFDTGTQIGPYRLVTFLGRGAFGQVWLAEKDSALTKTRLAVKLPLTDIVDIEAIRQEADVWVRAANHPNILGLFEANVYDGQVAIVSEYAPDGCLKRWLDQHHGKAPSFDVAADMGMAILAGLEHLHVRGIVHRDLKPANILMQGECPRIADFGLARVLGHDSTAGGVAGTPAYMAPEAFKGHKSVQTDLWSVSVILYQMLAGHLPFTSSDLSKLEVVIATEPVPPLAESIPSALRSVVSHALNKDANSRFSSAADMRAALRDARRVLEAETEPRLRSTSRGPRTVAVTGSMYADPDRTAHRVRELLTPYCGEQTTWYCGTVGTVDECAARFLLEQGQRVIAVGYGPGDISSNMRAILAQYGAPFVDAQNEQVPSVPGAPSRRDVFFASKADVIVMFWDGVSSGTAQLQKWLQERGKDYAVGFVGWLEKEYHPPN